MYPTAVNRPSTTPVVTVDGNDEPTVQTTQEFTTDGS